MRAPFHSRRGRFELAPALATSLAALCAGALGCAQPVVSIDVAVVTTACSGALVDPQRNPTDNVDTLQFTLTGDGLTATTINSPFSSGGARIPNIPLGTNRRITANALVSGSGLVRARADSGTFNVTADSQPQVTLFLRVVDAFVLTGSNSGTACTHLNTPRAGHQMTLLPDNTVLITGGYNIDSSGEVHYLTQAEIYNPHDGSFSVVANNAAIGRAGFAAFPVTVQGLAQVLLIGGEGPGTDGMPGPAGPFELYAGGAFTTVPLGTAQARERAAAALDVKTGFAVLAGGTNGPDVLNGSVTVFDSISYFNPQQDTVVEVDEPLAQPISDAVAVSRQNLPIGGSAQGGVVIIGGRDMSGNASAQISGVVFNESQHAYVADTAYEQPALALLPEPRVHHSAVVASDDTVLVLGGTTQADLTYASATDAVTVIAPAQAEVANATQVLSQGRGDGCAVLLSSGNVLFAGGAYGDSDGTHSAAAVDIISPAGQASTVRALEGPSAGGNWSLQAARHKAACLLLSDGTVLVTGGLQFQPSGSPIALGSAEIYTPPSP